MLSIFDMLRLLNLSFFLALSPWVMQFKYDSWISVIDCVIDCSYTVEESKFLKQEVGRKSYKLSHLDQNSSRVMRNGLVFPPRIFIWNRWHSFSLAWHCVSLKVAEGLRRFLNSRTCSLFDAVPALLRHIPVTSFSNR